MAFGARSQDRPRHRACGIPSLATYKAPVFAPEVQTKRTTRAETLRLKARNDTSSTTEVVPRATHFNFLGLPAELRIRIYEFCVSVTEYITYDKRDYCICGLKHFNQPSAVDQGACKYFPYGPGYISSRLPGCYYPVSPNYIDRSKWEISRREYARKLRTPRPHILAANRQIRDEALPIFYQTNDFVFEDCESLWVTRWLFNVVRPEHLKHIKSITWDGPLDWDDERRRLEDNTFVQMSSIIMLMQLKILGNCKLRLKPHVGNKKVHFACILHEKISSLVARKGLTAAHAENELSKVDELEVNGLIYCLAEKLSEFCREVSQSRAITYLPAGLH